MACIGRSPVACWRFDFRRQHRLALRNLMFKRRQILLPYRPAIENIELDFRCGRAPALMFLPALPLTPPADALRRRFNDAE
jgi:hypothetical protein